MKYFKEIYEAAKSRSENTLHQLFKKGACIDTRNNNNSLITPAGLLAQEGDLESAKYLVEFFGANPVFVAQGLFIAKNNDEAANWVKNYDINENLINSTTIENTWKTIKRYAFDTEIKSDTMTTHDSNHEAKVVTGEFDLAEFKKISFLNKSYYLDAMGHAGHIYLLEAIFNDSLFTKPLPSLNSLFAIKTYEGSIGFPVYRLQNEKLALHTFSFIKSDKFLAEILNKVTKEPILDGYAYDVEKVMNQARKIRTIMQTDKIGYSAAALLCDQRNISLPPLLQTSLPFYQKTTHVHTAPNQFVTHDVSYKIGFNMNK